MLMLGSFRALGQNRGFQGMVQPAAATSLVITDSAGVILTTLIPDSSGRFRFVADSASPTAYWCQVHSDGYLDQHLKLHDHLAGGELLVILKKGYEMAGVRVVSSRPVVERKIDRIVFNVENSPAAVGSNALDALKKAPLVQVANEQVAIAGRGTAAVMIDDKRVQLSGSDLEAMLRSISSEDIARIEVITNPSARYDAEGTSGLINIVTRKSRKAGLNLAPRLEYEQATQGTVMGGGTFNFRKNRLNVYGNINAVAGAKQPRNRITTPYPNQTWAEAADYKNRSQSVSSRVGIDYQIDTKNILGIQYNGLLSSPRRTDNISTNIIGPYGNTDSLLKTYARSENPIHSHEADLNYNHKFDTVGTSINLDVNILKYKSDKTRSYTMTNESASLLNPASNRIIGIQDIGISNLKVDVDMPAKYRLGIAFGAKISSVSNKSGNAFQNKVVDVYKDDSAKSNSFLYEEQMQAAYVNLSKDIGRWQVMLGIRGENTNVNAVSTHLASNRYGYFKLFPTAYMLYKLTDASSLSVNYSKRIFRPDYSNLNPFRTYLNNYQYVEGNPFLLPAISHNAELSLSLKNRYFVSLFYQHQDKVFNQVPLVDSAVNILAFIYANVGRRNSYGGSFYTSFTVGKWWTSSNQIQAYYDQFRSDYYASSVLLENLACTFTTTNQFFLDKGHAFIAELNYWYQFPTYIGFAKINGQGSLDLGIKGFFLSRKLSVGIAAADLLRSQRSVAVYSVSGIRTNNYGDTRSIRVSIGYKIGAALKEQRERSTGSEEERGRIK